MRAGRHGTVALSGVESARARRGSAVAGEAKAEGPACWLGSGLAAQGAAAKGASLRLRAALSPPPPGTERRVGGERGVMPEAAPCACAVSQDAAAAGPGLALPGALCSRSMPLIAGATGPAAASWPASGDLLPGGTLAEAQGLGSDLILPLMALPWASLAVAPPLADVLSGSALGSAGGGAELGAVLHTSSRKDLPWPESCARVSRDAAAGALRRRWASDWRTGWHDARARITARPFRAASRRPSGRVFAHPGHCAGVWGSPCGWIWRECAWLCGGSSQISAHAKISRQGADRTRARP